MLWECLNCGCLYAIGIPQCPHCLSSKRGELMPKITVHGGPSNADLEREMYKDPIVEEEESLAGINYSTSPQKQESSSYKKRTPRRKPAQTMENL